MRFQDLPLTELRDLAESIVTVAGAVEAGLFTALLDSPSTPAELADRVGLDRRAVGIVLPVLEELGLVEKDEGRYRLSPRGRGQLADTDSDEYQAGGLPLWLENLKVWVELPESLRTGRPVSRPDTGDDESDLARFMAGMAAAPAERVGRLVDATLQRNPRAANVLDLGGGPGHMTRAFVKRGLDGVLLDTPAVVEFVRDAYGLDAVQGLRTVSADFLSDPLPAGPFDIVLLSNVLHLLPADECAALLRKVRPITAPGGVVAIADFVRGRSPRASRFALFMLLRKEGGNTHTFEEHETWLHEAGFAQVEAVDLDPERQLVTAVRPDD